MERKRAQTGWLWWCLEQSAFFIATIKLIIIQQRHRWTHSITTDCSSSARSTFDENSWWFICIRDPVVQQFIHDISGLALLPSTLCSGQSDCALYVQRKSVSKQHFWCCSKYSFFFFSGAVEWEGRMTKREIVLVYKFNTCISNVDHFENCLRSSDMIWQVTDGNCFFVSGRVSFSTTFLPLYLPLMRSPVSSSELQREFW